MWRWNAGGIVATLCLASLAARAEAPQAPRRPAVPPALAAAPTKVDFQREVRPILSENCFQCHGPDGNTRMAALRLDRKEDALAERKHGRPVVPGDAAASLVWRRVNDAD